MELTRTKQIAWEYKADEKSEVHACQPLPNGRVLIVECGSSRLIEVDRAGKVAKEIKQIQVLDVPGDVTKGEILR